MKEFLENVVDATRRELNIASAEALAEAMRSGVVELPDAMRRSLRGARARTAIFLGLAIVALLSGIGVVIWMWRTRGGLASDPHLYGVVMGTLIAVGVSFHLAGAQARLAARRMGRGRPPLPEAFGEAHAIAIEPVGTYGRFKLVGDDVGLLWHDPYDRRLLIDGAAHRYLICADDVELIAAIGGPMSSGNRIEVRVASQRMSFVIAAIEPLPFSPDYATLGPRGQLRRRIEQTLGVADVS